MTRFILLSFVFLGWAFYETSGGAGFEPEAPARITRHKAEAASRAKTAKTTKVTRNDVATGAVKSNNLKSAGVLLASLDVSDTQSVLASAASADTALFAPRQTLFSLPAPTPLAQRAKLNIHNTGATPDMDQPKATLDLRKIRVARVNMRNGPGTHYSVLSKLMRGDQLQVLRDPGNGWVKLRVVDGGRIGWVAASLLAKTN